MTLHDCPIPTLQLILKRFMDLVASGITLILLAPFLLVVMAIIKLDSKGPLFLRISPCRQKRSNLRLPQVPHDGRECR